MRILVATLLVPALALAQAPIRPPPPTGGPTGPITRPGGVPRPLPALPPQPGAAAPTAPRPTGTPIQTTPTTPTTPAPGAAAPTASPAPARGNEGTTVFRPNDRKCVPIQGTFDLAFNKADIVDILEQASRWTCRNFVYTEDVARGKITLLSKAPVTADEAYAAFLAALNANNIAIYPTGKYYKLIRTADAKKNPIPTFTDTESGTPSNEQPITKVVRLTYADADQLRGILGNFTSPQGADIQSIPPDTLIITDIGLNLRRIEKLIDAIDRAGAGDAVRLVQIRYASAKDIADKINQIFQAQGGAGKGTRRPLIGNRPAPGVPAGAAPAPAAGAAGGATEVSVYKVLPDDRTNKLIIIADDKSFQRIQELIDQLDVPTSGEGGIHVVFLKHANAEDMATTLSNLAQGKKGGSSGGAPGALPAGVTPPMVGQRAAAAPADAVAELFSGDVKITADKTQNALLVQASGADFAAISRLVERLDRPRRQVFIEAVIMEVNLRSEITVGVGAHAAVPLKYKGDNGILPLLSEPGRVSSLNASSALSLGGFLTGFVGPVSADLKALGLNIPSIGVLIQALQSDSDVNVLSTPHLLATDNEDSEISVGQNVPFQTGFVSSGVTNLLAGAAGTNSTTTSGLGSLLGTGGIGGLTSGIQRQNVELRLKIKPQINDGGNVRLTIDEQTEEIADRDAQLGPTTAKRSVKTQVVARDQSTIVIGGLIQDRNVKSVKKLPFLGSLPILGWLFRDTTTTRQKTNLLLFLTPYIIRDEADYRRIYERKRREYQQFVEQFYGRQPSYEVDIDFGRKAGPYSKIHQGVEEETRRLENGGEGLPDERMTRPAAAAPALPAPQPALPAPGQPRLPTTPVPPRRAAPEEAPAVDKLEVQPEIPPPAQAPAQPPPGQGG